MIIISLYRCLTIAITIYYYHGWSISGRPYFYVSFALILTDILQLPHWPHFATLYCVYGSVGQHAEMSRETEQRQNEGVWGNSKEGRNGQTYGIEMNEKSTQTSKQQQKKTRVHTPRAHCAIYRVAFVCMAI